MLYVSRLALQQSRRNLYTRNPIRHGYISMSTEPNTLVFNREMSITHAEFLRILPSAVGPQPVSRKNNAVRIAEGEREILIRLSQQRERAIGALRLPVTDIELRLSGYTEAEAKTFMARFDLHYRKGGG
jgi:hypothetical protein